MDDPTNPCLICECSESHEWPGMWSGVAGGRPLKPEPLKLPQERRPAMLQPDRATAEAEAKRLAMAHPGKRFIVFEAITAAHTVDVPTHTTISGQPWGARRVAVLLSVGEDDGIPF